VYDNPQFVPLEINPIVAEAKAMKGLARALQVPELVQVALEHFSGKSAKFAQNVELQFPRHCGQFRGARRIENNLELHGKSLAAAAKCSTFNVRPFAESASRCRRA
jgi:hypothetical protein